MFWIRRKKSDVAQGMKQTEPNPPSGATAQEDVETAARKLATALVEYERHALRVEGPEPDPDRDEAYRKVRLAKQIVEEGRISYALCRQLLEHIEHWPAWIKRDDFAKHVVFDAHDVTAQEEETKDGIRGKTINVAFSFGEHRYRVVFTDKGFSHVPEDTTKYGEVEFYVDDCLVLGMDVRQELDELTHWQCNTVKALAPGDWMQGLLRISAQIEMRNRARLESYLDRRIRDASANIRLPDDGGSHEGEH